MSEAAPAALLDLAEVSGWIGSELDDCDGKTVGRVEWIYADAEGARPVWLVVALGRQRARRLRFGRRGVKKIAVPLRECAAMPGRVWTALGREAMSNAPVIDPSRSLLREHEMTICLRYGITEQVGRHAEVANRAAGSVTAQPALVSD
jgi:hypothetical protein